MTADIEIRNVSKHFGAMSVLEDLSLSIKAREFIVFLGPSGCGKSTLLRMIAGLETVDSGEIAINNERIDHLPPGKRGIAMVFQSYALYPHMSVRDNMAFGLENIGMSREVIDARINEAARILECRICSSANLASFRAASASVSPSAVRSSRNRRPSCSTSRSPISMRLCAPAPASKFRDLSRQISSAGIRPVDLTKSINQKADYHCNKEPR